MRVLTFFWWAVSGGHTAMYDEHAHLCPAASNGLYLLSMASSLCSEVATTATN